MGFHRNAEMNEDFLVPHMVVVVSRQRPDLPHT
jgi:hypothetical protein